jgi:hypothetical protein
MLSNFPKIINQFLGDIPKDDYPVLNTFKIVKLATMAESPMGKFFDENGEIPCKHS